jgi:hypothetical protein
VEVITQLKKLNEKYRTKLFPFSFRFFSRSDKNLLEEEDQKRKKKKKRKKERKKTKKEERKKKHKLNRNQRKGGTE